MEPNTKEKHLKTIQRIIPAKFGHILRYGETPGKLLKGLSYIFSSLKMYPGHNSLLVCIIVWTTKLMRKDGRNRPRRMFIISVYLCLYKHRFYPPAVTMFYNVSIPIQSPCNAVCLHTYSCQYCSPFISFSRQSLLVTLPAQDFPTIVPETISALTPSFS